MGRKVIHLKRGDDGKGELIILYEVLKLNRIHSNLERVGGVLCSSLEEHWCFSDDAPANYLIARAAAVKK